MRDIFYRQELNKMKISNDKWLCKYCNKTFYSEYYLDMHFVNRHNDTLLRVKIIWNCLYRETKNLYFRVNNLYVYRIIVRFFDVMF